MVTNTDAAEHRIVTAMKRVCAVADQELRIIRAVCAGKDHPMFDEHVGLHGYFSDVMRVLRYGHRVSRWSMQERFDNVLPDSTVTLSNRLSTLLNDLLFTRTVRGKFVEWFVVQPAPFQRQLLRIDEGFAEELLRAVWCRGHQAVHAQLLACRS